MTYFASTATEDRGRASERERRPSNKDKSVSWCWRRRRALMWMYANTNNWFLNMYLFMRHFLSSSKGKCDGVVAGALQPLPICVVSLMLCASHFIPFAVSSIDSFQHDFVFVFWFAFFFCTQMFFLSLLEVGESWVHSEALHCVAYANYFIVLFFSFRFFCSASLQMFNLKCLAENKKKREREKYQWHRFRSDSLG